MIPIDKRIDLLRVIAHPVRIRILEDLREGTAALPFGPGQWAHYSQERMRNV